ncbi:hypothetical protein Hamer_G009226, partial [Homarus americanus]
MARVHLIFYLLLSASSSSSSASSSSSSASSSSSSSYLLLCLFLLFYFFLLLLFLLCLFLTMHKMEGRGRGRGKYSSRGITRRSILGRGIITENQQQHEGAKRSAESRPHIDRPLRHQTRSHCKHPPAVSVREFGSPAGAVLSGARVCFLSRV